MQLGRVIGQAVATVKHPSMHGWRLLLLQLLGVDGRPDGEPILAIDNLGIAPGSLVIACNEEAEARKLVGARTRRSAGFVLGVCDA